MNEKEFEEWRKRQKGFSLFFDGASKNNPRKSGAGGVIIDPNGKTIVSYEWGLGESTNNKAKAYSLLLDTRILKQYAIKDPIIISDSVIIIEAMIEYKNPSNTAINRIYQRIGSNIKGLGKTTFKHVLRTKIKRLTPLLTRLLKEKLEVLRKKMKLFASPSRDSWRKEKRLMEKGMIILGEGCEQNIPIRKSTTQNQKEDMFLDASIRYLQGSEYKIHSKYKNLHHMKVKIHMHPHSLSGVSICLFNAKLQENNCFKNGI